MKAYLLKRLLLMIPTLVGITLVTYGIVRLAPGDPIEAMIRSQTGDINPKVPKVKSGHAFAVEATEFAASVETG